MATNNILGFCTGANPNVLTPTAWQTTPARSSGFVSGIALSSHVNTAVVGGANIAHAVGEFIKNQLNEDVNPTDEAELVSQFLRALQIFIQRGGACPVGSIIPYLGGDVPYGWLLANGASVLRSQYNKLFALIGTKFGAVDEAHFNLPNLHHRFIEGTTSLSEVGSYVEAGLPNILSSGRGFDDQFDISQYGFHDLTGAMFISRQGLENLTVICMKVIHPDHSLGLSMPRETLLSSELRQPTNPPLYSFIALFAIDTE